MITSGMSLGKRLTLSFTVIIAFMASLTIFSSVRSAGLHNEIGLIVNDRYPKTNIANRVKAHINEIFRGMLGILVMANPKQIKAELDITLTDEKGRDLFKSVVGFLVTRSIVGPLKRPCVSPTGWLPQTLPLTFKPVAKRK